MKRKIPVLPIAFGVVAIILVAAVLFAPSGTDYFGSPDVAGETLPTLQGGGTDPAVGIAAPNVVGADFAGDEVAIPSPGKGTVLLFLAHWCPHCQAEVPEVQAWVNSAILPEDVELVGVVTGTNSGRDNYPPDEWLEREGWSSRLILDDADGTIGAAYGLTSYPYWVFIDADGTIIGRAGGGIDVATFQQAVGVLAS